MNTREFTAMTQSAKGGTQAVTVRASDEAHAREILARQGYARILWIL